MRKFCFLRRVASGDPVAFFFVVDVLDIRGALIGGIDAGLRAEGRPEHRDRGHAANRDYPRKDDVRTPDLFVVPKANGSKPFAKHVVSPVYALWLALDASFTGGPTAKGHCFRKRKRVSRELGG